MTSNEIKLDMERRARLGFDEAIFCAGKSIAQLASIMEAADGASLLLTRLEPEAARALPTQWQANIDYDPVSRTGFFGTPAPVASDARVAVVTAGTSDVPMSREAQRTLRYYGEAAQEITDVGVAGLWRVLERIDEIRGFPVVIVAAGLDGALPSVIGGLVPGMIIALPTSTGYGVAHGGMTALNSALTSCAPGVLVCNIDNGYGAACAALRALRAFTPAD